MPSDHQSDRLLEEIGLAAVQLAEASEHWNAAFEINRYGERDRVQADYDRVRTIQNRLWKNLQRLERRLSQLAGRYRDLTDPIRTT